jgi:hypothetical protein
VSDKVVPKNVTQQIRKEVLMFRLEIIMTDPPGRELRSGDTVASILDHNEISGTDLDKVAGGSQSSGAGAGKVCFNPFPITRK